MVATPVIFWIILAVLILAAAGTAAYVYYKRRLPPPSGPVIMAGTQALITAGYIPSRSMPSCYWVADYFPEYGTGTPPEPEPIAWTNRAVFIKRMAKR